jgi:hypothetical protein
MPSPTRPVTPADVREILQTSLTDPQLEAFILPANAVVEAHLVGEDCMTDELLFEIERWLAAHFASIRDKASRVTSEKIGDAEETYGNKTGFGLNYTPYGQQVKFLDCTGNLDTLDETKRKVIFETLKG